MDNILGEKTQVSNYERTIRKEFEDIFKDCPIPADQALCNLGLFINSKNLSRIFFLKFLYEKIIDTQGVIFDLGTRWGQNMSVFSALRGIYEPFNRHRKIIGFDTFEGFPAIDEKDGSSDLMKEGNVSVTNKYEEYLDKIMRYQENDNPLNHIKKYEIIKGDASIEVEKYLSENPQTLISLVYFDFDIYKPTKKCLELIKPYIFKGSVIAFDELNDSDSPGETIALREVFNINHIELKRYKYTSRVSYFVYNGE